MSEHGERAPLTEEEVHEKYGWQPKGSHEKDDDSNEAAVPATDETTNTGRYDPVAHALELVRLGDQRLYSLENGPASSTYDERMREQEAAAAAGPEHQVDPSNQQTFDI